MKTFTHNTALNMSQVGISSLFSGAKRTASGRQGMALVMVLGILSILVVLGVAFAVSMRTERLAARYHADMTRIRFLAEASLFRAMEELDTLDVYPVDDFVPGDASQNDVVFLAPAGSGKTGHAIMFLPGSLHNEADVYGRRPNGVAWMPLDMPDIATNVKVEFAYLIANTSGLLDVNVIAELTARERGYDAGEIRFSEDVLPEVFASTLKEYRDGFGRFENLSELYYLASTTVFQSPAQLGALRPLKQLPRANDHLHVYSRFPRGYIDDQTNAVTEVAFISGEPSGWDEAELDAALQPVMGDAQQREMFINALHDFADSGIVPRALNQYTTKPVPLINEIVGRASRSMVPAADPLDPDVPSITLNVVVETAFLFPFTASGAQFYVHLPDPEIRIDGVARTFDPVSGPTPAVINTSNPYTVTIYTYNWVSPDPLPAEVEVELVFNEPIEVRLVNDDVPVDRVEATWPEEAFLFSDQLSMIDPSPHIFHAQAANDPRINWNPANPLHWQSTGAAHSLNNPNTTVSHAEGETDEYGFMYCALRPFNSVGEIGYLLYDPEKPWTTIRLIGNDPDNMREILNVLTVHDEPIRRGLVNINTRQTNALAAVFFECPIEQYPGASFTELGTNAIPIAAGMVAQSNGNPQRNVSGAGTLLSGVSGLDALLDTSDKFTRESLLRNSIGLLGTRHQLFTIFVAARMFSDAYDPALHYSERDEYVAAEDRLMAVVWRDPALTEHNGVMTHQTIKIGRAHV